MKGTSRKLLSLLLVFAMVLGLFASTATAASAGSDVQIVDLRVNDLTEPLGLDDTTPTFAWKMQSDAIGAAQTAYQLVVADNAAMKKPVWDTGKVVSGEAVGIIYNGTDLQPQTTYYWQVTVWDQNGTPVQSEVSSFEMGLMDAGQWGNEIQWISVSEATEDTHYTVEVDIHSSTNAVSLVFGTRDSNHFYMAQLRADADGAYYKPHVYAGSWNYELVNLTKNYGIALDDFKANPVHLTIDVTANTITSFVNGTQVHQMAASSNVPVKGIGALGLRCTGVDVGYMDNIVVTDYTFSEEGKVVAQYNFDDGVNPFGYGTITNGELVINGNNTTVLKFDPNEYEREAETEERAGTASFRKDFAVGENLVSARLYSTALGVYDAFLNGQRVGRMLDDGTMEYDELKPGSTDAKARKLYYTYDVTNMLQAGQTNTLAAWVTGGWWIGRIVSRAGGQENAFAAKLVLTYADGREEILCTDTTWQGAYTGPMIYGDIYNGETYDATCSRDWMLPGQAESWRNVHKNTEFTGTVEAHNGTTAQIRQDRELTPVELYVYSEVTGATGDRYGKVVVDRTYTDGEDVVLEPGETLIVDMGQNHSGWEQFVVSGTAGSTVKVRHAEILNDREGLKSRYNDGPEGSILTSYLRTALTTTAYTLSGNGRESYHPTMSYYGYRYLEVTADQTVTIHSIRSQVLTNTTWDSGSITTSNEKVNKLFSNALWGQYSNYISVPTDCPQRDERYGWLADTQVFAATAQYNSTSTKAFLQKWLQDVRDCQLSDGRYQSVSPGGGEYGNNYGRVGWADAGIVVPYNMYVMSGDTSIIAEHYASMQLYVDKYLASTNKKGPEQGYGDWMAPDDNNDDLVKSICAVAYYAWDALMMADMANALGKTEDAARYQALYETEKAYFIERFVQADGTLTSKRQTPALFALYLDLLPNEQSREAVKTDLQTAIENNGNKLATGFLGTPILLKVLTEEGLNDLAYTLLLQEGNPSWLYSVNNGATTTWERWDSYTKESGLTSTGNCSMNHYAYGSVAEWMYGYMGGIKYEAAQPGFKRIHLEPAPSQLLGSASATYDSPYGTIESAWVYENDTLIYDATVPANTTAQICLPVEQLSTLTVNGKAYTEVTLAQDGIVFTAQENGAAVFEAVAGKFHFVSAVTRQTYLTITAGETDNIPAYATVDGETHLLPVTLTVKSGETLSLQGICANDVDYQTTGWTDASGNVLSTGSALEYTVTEKAELKVSFTQKNRWNLAVGAAVEGTQVNATWATKNLTDGAYNHTQGPSGWSSANTKKTVFDSPVTATIDLGTIQEVDRFQLYPRTDTKADNQPLCFPKDYSILVSENGSEWTEVYATTDEEAVCWRPAVVQLNQTVTARYVRLSVNSVNQGDDKGNVYVQLAELGVYNTTQAERVKLTVDTSFDQPVVFTLNGVEQELSKTVMLENGEEVTLFAQAKNNVDYELTGWFDGDGKLLSQDAAYQFTVNEDTTVTAKFAWCGHKSLAEGKSVTADAVNGSWSAANLTDGVLNYLGGTNGWSSVDLNKKTSFDEVPVVIDLGETTAFNRFHIYPRNLPSNHGVTEVMCCPTAYTFYVSDDKVEWTPVYATTEGEVTNGFAPIVVNLEEAVSARYVKMGITAIGRLDDIGNSYVQLSELGIYLVDAPEKNVTLSVTGADEAALNAETISYHVSAGQMQELATAILSFEISEETLVQPQAVAGEGWMVILQTYENGILTVVMGNLEGANGTGELLTINAKPTGKTGDATVTLKKVELSAYTEDTEIIVDADILAASATTQVTYNKYDVNHDGIVDLLDITRAQRYYGTEFAACDVDHDGIVNIQDLILIMNNFTEPV